MHPSRLSYFLVYVTMHITSSSKGCDRSRSRLVRKVVYEKLMPAFSELNTELADTCIFSPARDNYRAQETHKSIEDGINWQCHFCGKAFVTEYFLDLHFDNRHTDQLEGENSLCLADVCEVFRCDIIGRSLIPDFWDVALCLEDDMKSLHHKCSLMVDSCVPSGLTENETRWLTDVTKKELCSYLTCSKYWEMIFDPKMTEGTGGLYVVMAVMIIFGIIIYYFLFFAYFFTDTFSDAVSLGSPTQTKNSSKPHQGDLRHRPRFSTHSD